MIVVRLEGVNVCNKTMVAGLEGVNVCNETMVAGLEGVVWSICHKPSVLLVRIMVPRKTVHQVT